jgi:hypothetical protein
MERTTLIPNFQGLAELEKLGISTISLPLHVACRADVVEYVLSQKKYTTPFQCSSNKLQTVENIIKQGEEICKLFNSTTKEDVDIVEYRVELECLKGAIERRLQQRCVSNVPHFANNIHIGYVSWKTLKLWFLDKTPVITYRKTRIQDKVVMAKVLNFRFRKSMPSLCSPNWHQYGYIRSDGVEIQIRIEYFAICFNTLTNAVSTNVRYSVFGRMWPFDFSKIY